MIRRHDAAPPIGMPPISILGAGAAGLTAANDLYRRGYPIDVFEAGPAIAGMAQSFKDENGVRYDFGPHLITSRLAAALGVAERCHVLTEWEETVLVKGKFYGFPYGLLSSPQIVASALAARATFWRDRSIQSAADWYRVNCGKRMAEDIAIPLVEGWAGVSADELSPAVIPPQADRGIANVLSMKLAAKASGRASANGVTRAKPESPHIWQVYPNGGMVDLCNRLAHGLEDRISVQTRVEKIIVENNEVRAVVVHGEERESSAVVSTAPIHILPKLVEGTEALDHFSEFRYRPMVLALMTFRERPFLPTTLVWTPERERPFFKLVEVPRAVPFLAPEGMTSINADIGCELDSDIWQMSEEEVGEMVLGHLEEMFPGARRRFVRCRVVKTPIGYPLYLRKYEHHREALEVGLPVKGLYTVGRSGEFAHILMEDVFWRSLDRMRQLRSDLATMYATTGSS